MIAIYYYENKINGKIYIGQTNRDKLSHRSGKSGDQYKTSKTFYNAIKKYGWNNFEATIFKMVDTKELANQEEMFWIAEMRNQLGRKMVYNIKDGGNTNPHGRKHTPESIAKIKQNGKEQFVKGNAPHNKYNLPIENIKNDNRKVKIILKEYNISRSVYYRIINGERQ